MAMIGFDFGTSNCAVGVITNGHPELVPLGEHGRYMSSSLYAPSRSIIPHWLSKQLLPEQRVAYTSKRTAQLQKGQAELRELQLDGIAPDLYFGQAALTRYLEDPEEGYYIKSPKSFLGASGLVRQQIELFEDIIAAMMLHIKTLAETELAEEITHAVIGRPVNFQGLKGEESNQQAIQVLTRAANRVGFKAVEFQFEPVAAGFEFEASLTEEKKVLVVDIGGGTSDCSMLLMGPQYRNQLNRSQHLLSHSGQRIGGNDFDIQLALQGIMPNLGMGSALKTGKPIPVKNFWNAVEINNIVAQTDFYNQANGRFLEELCRDAEQPTLLKRLLKTHKEKLSYQLVNGAEQAKIGLTDSDEQNINLSFLDSDLNQTVNRNSLLVANKRQLDGIGQLMKSAIEQAGCQPDVVFVTGGTAKSPVLNQFLRGQVSVNTPLVIGDHFGSVTSGLSRWAKTIFS